MLQFTAPSRHAILARLQIFVTGSLSNKKKPHLTLPRDLGCYLMLLYSEELLLQPALSLVIQLFLDSVVVFVVVVATWKTVIL